MSAANYKAAGLSVPSKTPYVSVEPSLYEGSWTGKYPDNKTFTIKVSQVTGFRAKVQYQSGITNKYQDVLIKDYAFPTWDEPLPPSLVFLQSCLALTESKVHPLLRRGAEAVVGSSTRIYSASR